jgi:peptide chain release factor
MSEHLLLLLSAGRGPQECTWAVARLVRRLEAGAGRDGLTTHRAETVPGDRPGTFRSVLVRISGTGAARFAASWTGTLCWQAPSPYRTSAGRKNWYVIAQPCEVDAAHTAFAEADVDIVGCRTGGPGGQHRRLALERIRARLDQGDRAADRAVIIGRRQIHEALIRGNPTRVERPDDFPQK